MPFFDKSREELERENRQLREQLRQARSRPQKRVLYQCRYCSYKSIRNATEGAPLPGVNNCPRHPRGTHKGPHSWMRTYLQD